MYLYMSHNRIIECLLCNLKAFKSLFTSVTQVNYLSNRRFLRKGKQIPLPNQWLLDTKHAYIHIYCMCKNSLKLQYFIQGINVQYTTIQCNVLQMSKTCILLLNVLSNFLRQLKALSTFFSIVQY